MFRQLSARIYLTLQTTDYRLRERLALAKPPSRGKGRQAEIRVGYGLDIMLIKRKYFRAWVIR